MDVSIRDTGDGPVIAICECRDRAGVEDVTWVEQVVTKARDLKGSPPAVLVSSSGFSAPAREKAAAYGHDVRLVTNATLEEFQSWFQMEHVILVVCDRGLRGCDIELTPDDAEDFSPSVSEALARDGLGACIFERQRLWPVSAMHIFEEWWKRTQGQVERDVPADGRPVRRPVPITFEQPEESFSVETELGPRPVAAVRLHVEVSRTKRLVPASRVARYSKSDSDLAESVEFDLDGNMGTVSLHKMSDGPIHVRWRPPDEG